MPRSNNYYDNKLDEVEPQQPQSFDTQKQQNISLGIQPEQIEQNQQRALENATVDSARIDANRSLVNSWPYELAGAVFDMPDQGYWDSLSGTEKAKHIGKESAKFSWNFLKAFPKEIVKAPLAISHSLMDLETAALDKISGYKQGENKALDALRYDKTYSLPVLGEIKGVRATFDEGIKAGLPPFFAAVHSTGRLAGDIAITASLSEAINATVFNPRVKTISKTKTVDNPFLVAEEIKVGSEAGAIAKQAGGILEATADKSIQYMPVPKSIATKYKGNSNNIKLKIVPYGAGKAKVSIVRISKSWIDKTKDFLTNKFGKSKVTEGMFGPELEVDAGLIKYNPEVFTQKPSVTIKPVAEAPLAGVMENIATSKYQTNLSVEANKQNGASQQYEKNVVDPYAKEETTSINQRAMNKEKKENIPSVMNKPLKGFGDSAVTEKQTGQILNLSKSKEIEDTTLQAITKVISGKDNIFELTQNEAFDVSETVRNFPGDVELENLDSSVLLRSYTHPARYWMEPIERTMGVPVYSEIYLRFETGARLLKIYSEKWRQEARNIYGKYAKPKYLEERRLITSYIEGNKDVITKNGSLSPETKADLVKVGDWLTEQYKEFFKKYNIDSKKWFEIYSPRLKKRGSISEFYKSSELPLEIKAFFEFEREGSLDILEDDSLALFDMYIRAGGKKDFLSKPLEDSNKILSTAPENVKAATNDYIQEKMGYQGKTEEFMNNFGKKLSNKSKGIIPETIMKDVVDTAMTLSYAGALGLPRILPILRNTVQPLLLTYPDIGPKWFIEGVKLYRKNGIKKWKDKGFLVEMGVPYGAELSEASGKGKFGKAVDMYKGANRIAMKPYASADARNRSITAYSAEARIDNAIERIKNGEIDYRQFEREIDMAGFNPTLQDVIAKKLRENTAESIEEAKDLMIMDILDRTQFPYRKGAETRMHYGMKGKMGLQFSQWTWEYAFTLKSWAARGQWEKFVRWYAMSSVLKRSAEESFGVDIDKWVNFGPISGIPLGPLANVVGSMYRGIEASATKMDDDVNKYWKEIVGTMKIYGGIATGVGTQKLVDFYKSIDRYEAGIAVSTDEDPNKKFGVWSSTGKLIRWVDFAELLKIATGFKPTEGTEQSEKIRAAKKDNLIYQKKIDEAMNYLVDGNFEKFNEKVISEQLIISDIATKMKSYSIPLDKRIFERLSLPLKDKYFNLFYPSN